MRVGGSGGGLVGVVSTHEGVGGVMRAKPDFPTEEETGRSRIAPPGRCCLGCGKLPQQVHFVKSWLGRHAVDSGGMVEAGEPAGR